MGHDEWTVVGPPGTGKTTWLVRQARHAVESRRSSGDVLDNPPDENGDGVLISSLTRAAAREVLDPKRGAPLDGRSVGTLHAHAWRALGCPELVIAKKDYLADWNETHPEFGLASFGGEKFTDNDGEIARAATDDGERLLFDYHRMRALLRDRNLWGGRLQEFAEAYDRWKFDRDLVDFSDVIERAYLLVDAAPGDPRIIFVDEAQDHDRSELRLVRKWARRADRLIVIGDPDQCQPPGTMVLLAGGALKRIEELDPAVDRVACLDRHAGVLVGTREGYQIQVASRPYYGDLIEVSAGGKQSLYTPDHRCIVKWIDKAAHRCCVYLMQRGNRFRVGWCQMFGGNSEGVFHVGTRARIEKADATWVLAVFESRREASAYESYVAAEYGMPLITFRPIDESGHYTQETIDEVFGRLDPHRQHERASRCLAAHGRDWRYPIWSAAKQHVKRGICRVQVVHACNLLPGIMSLPVHDGNRGIEWHPLDATRIEYSGDVYSLQVDKHENYVADGIVTHNCIYAWRGADPKAFWGDDIPDDHRRTLSQSYRVPRAVHRAAVDMIERVADRRPVEYMPRDADGSVGSAWCITDASAQYVVREAAEHVKAGRTVMFLAACQYMLRHLAAALRNEGLPYWNPFAPKNGFFNPLHPHSGRSITNRLLRQLKIRDDLGISGPPYMWSACDLLEWVGLCNHTGLLKRGAVKQIERLDPGYVPTVDQLREWFDSEAVLAEIAQGDPRTLLNWAKPDKRKNLEFAVAAFHACGLSALTDDPRVILGTVHSVKGGEADVVYVSPDLSMNGHEGYTNGGEGRDATHRLFYVAMTRARERLVLCEPGARRGIDW